MAPFMVLGIKLRKFLHLPGIHIKSKENGKCISCGKCNQVCPMAINVVDEIRNRVIDNLECIQCGACIDHCSKKVLSYGMVEGKENDYGK